ncbi:DHA2 family efflux MFS transporter permease subunit [Streptomyces arboris]|uniref:DHA2 family efflux MFS transporter permease subunit n=1 Tax=Streptomyces arboris TaxID=2600619 RepID=A0A5N5EQS7_9ACTN|nr:DHA2 family efflux MFS transporter permease subunit [Streptomyces arboris]KAB2592763.1 DHA2 family efflux MFS transporter permease subunit [Streptomyces arboris]
MTLSGSPSAPPAVSTRRASLALLLACAGTFLSFLDATVTNLAVPLIAADFEASLTTVSWVATAYVIPFAALLAPAGPLADAVGRARLFLIGVAVFTVSSLLIALAPTLPVLLGARGLQGLAAALLVPASLGLVLAEVPAERRRAAIGMWSAAGALAAAGPALGGVMVEALDWRVLFCLNVPVGLWVLVAGRKLVTGESRTGHGPDLAGGLLLALSVGSAVYGLTQGPDHGWSSVHVLVAAGVTVLAGVATVLRALRHQRPALRLDLFRNRTFAVASGVSLAYGTALFTTMLLGVLFLTDAWDYSTLEAGLAMSPAALVTAVVGIGIGRLPVALTPRTLVAAGSSLIAASTALLALLIDTEPHFWTLWLPSGTVMGVGVGMATVGISSAAALSAPPQHFAAATGMVMAARQVGGALGIATTAVIIAEVMGNGAEPYAAVYWFATAANLAAAVGGLALRVTAPPLSKPAAYPAPAVARTLEGDQR